MSSGSPVLVRTTHIYTRLISKLTLKNPTLCCVVTPEAGRDVPVAATRIYEMSFFTGFGVSALVYWCLNLAFPVPGMSAGSKFDEIDVSEFVDDNAAAAAAAAEDKGKGKDDGAIFVQDVVE